MTPKCWSQKVLSLLNLQSKQLLEITRTIKGWCSVYVTVDRFTDRMKQESCSEKRDLQKLIMERKGEQPKVGDRVDEGVSFDLTETYYPSIAAHSSASPPALETMEKVRISPLPAWIPPPRRETVSAPAEDFDFVLFGD